MLTELTCCCSSHLVSGNSLCPLSCTSIKGLRNRGAAKVSIRSKQYDRTDRYAQYAPAEPLPPGGTGRERGGTGRGGAGRFASDSVGFPSASSCRVGIHGEEETKSGLIQLLHYLFLRFFFCFAFFFVSIFVFLDGFLS